MRSDLSVDVRSLSKAYRVGRPASSGPRLRLAVADRLRHPLRGGADRFWALRDVSFGASAGEVVGVIGRNGAGKSTLLKVLSRVTEPTSGEAELNGRVGCLLEVGTGFHQELTGMENIFLNGAILGMRRHEIRSRLEEIVEFSGIERFLNTPVKRYSSGMYVRLAFAVAAHLDPEILIIDEVLAVGDAEFQKKCLGKIHSVAAEGGRTVLFVSHNAGAIRSLCDRALLLERGRVVFDGPADQTLARYAASFQDGPSEPGTFDLAERRNPLGGQWPVLLRKLVVEGPDGPSSDLCFGRAARFRIACAGTGEVRLPYFRLHVRNGLDQCVLATDSRMGSAAMRPDGATFEIDRLPLLPGTYFVDVGFGTGVGRNVLDHVVDAGRFHVGGGDVYGDGYQLIPEDGSVYVPPRWAPGGAEGLPEDIPEALVDLVGPAVLGDRLDEDSWR